MSPTIDWESKNEQDVREEFIAPFVRSLGYHSGEENHVSREKTLRYPRIYLGRKKLKRDPMVSGKADYIFDLKMQNGVLRWVLESKPPHEDLDLNAAEQAYTYARHPEVAALLYGLCNGRKFVLYDASHAPGESVPVYTGDWPEWTESLSLRDIVSPNSMRLRYRHVAELKGEPLGTGLPSRVAIKSGYIRYRTASPLVAHLTKTSIPLVEGSVLERNHDGTLRLLIYVGFHDHEMEARMREWGQTDTLLYSTDTRVSDNPLKPTIFTGGREICFPEGGQIRDLIAGIDDVTLPAAFHSRSYLEVSGYLREGVFAGTVILHLISADASEMPFVLQGDFRAQLL